MNVARANCWPTPSQQLVLQAALGPEEQAYHSWFQYIQQVDILQADYASAQLFPLIYCNFKKYLTAEDSIKYLNVGKSIYKHTWVANQSAFNQLNKLLQKFSSASISTCLLKGAALITAGYYRFGERSMGDIDILISPDRVADAILLLKKLGWTIVVNEFLSLHEYMQTHHALLFTYGGEFKLDLHWHLSPEHSASSLIYEPIMRKCLVHFLSAPVSLLKPEEQLLHIIDHGIRYSPQPLIRWIPDAVRLLKNHADFNWMFFIESAKEWRIFLRVKWALTFLHQNKFYFFSEEVDKFFKDYHADWQEISYANFVVTNHNRWLLPFLAIWQQHIRMINNKTLVKAIITFPNFLMKWWKVKRYWQLPIILIKKCMQHFKRQFLNLTY